MRNSISISLRHLEGAQANLTDKKTPIPWSWRPRSRISPQKVKIKLRLSYTLLDTNEVWIYLIGQPFGNTR